jgi:hypothetical protein
MARVESSRLIKIGPVSCAPVLSRLNNVNASNTAQNNPTEKRRWREFDDAGIGATGNPDNVGSREVIYHNEIEERSSADNADFFSKRNYQPNVSK